MGSRACGRNLELRGLWFGKGLVESFVLILSGSRLEIVATSKLLIRLVGSVCRGSIGANPYEVQLAW